MSKLSGIDWVKENNTDSIDMKVLYIYNWTTEIRKTLRGGGLYKNFGHVSRLVGQRFSKRKRDHVYEVLRLMRMGDMCDILDCFSHAKSFINSSDFVKFFCKHPWNAGDIKLTKKRFEVL
jgi:hypothetical protein